MQGTEPRAGEASGVLRTSGRGHGPELRTRTRNHVPGKGQQHGQCARALPPARLHPSARHPDHCVSAARRTDVLTSNRCWGTDPRACPRANESEPCTGRAAAAEARALQTRTAQRLPHSTSTPIKNGPQC